LPRLPVEAPLDQSRYIVHQEPEVATEPGLRLGLLDYSFQRQISRFDR
jgi:hypothetical protein